MGGLASAWSWKVNYGFPLAMHIEPVWTKNLGEQNIKKNETSFFIS